MPLNFFSDLITKYGLIINGKLSKTENRKTAEKFVRTRTIQKIYLSNQRIKHLKYILGFALEAFTY